MSRCFDAVTVGTEQSFAGLTQGRSVDKFVRLG
jgi:hypothetical protein